MSHKQLKPLYDSINNHLENIASQLLTNVVQHDEFNDVEQMLDDYDRNPSTDLPSSSSHATDSWISDASTAIN